MGKIPYERFYEIENVAEGRISNGRIGETKRVEQTKSIEILNLYLDIGWILIAAATPMHEQAQFTVGWIKGDKIIYPEFIRAGRNKELPPHLYGDMMTEENSYYFYLMEN